MATSERDLVKNLRSGFKLQRLRLMMEPEPAISWRSRQAQIFRDPSREDSLKAIGRERDTNLKVRAKHPKASELESELESDAKDDLKSLPVSEVEQKLESSSDGMSQAKAQKRLTQHGPTKLQ